MTQLSNLLNFPYLLFHRNVEKLRNNPKSYSCGIQDNKHRKSFYFKSRTTKVTTVIDVSWVFRNCWVWCADEIVWSSALRERDRWEKDDKKLIKKRLTFHIWITILARPLWWFIASAAYKHSNTIIQYICEPVFSRKTLSKAQSPRKTKFTDKINQIFSFIIQFTWNHRNTWIEIF